MQRKQVSVLHLLPPPCWAKVTADMNQLQSLHLQSLSLTPAADKICHLQTSARLNCRTTSMGQLHTPAREK